MPLLKRLGHSESLVANRGQKTRPASMQQHDDGDAESGSLAFHKRPALFETCANPGCRSGWFHLWRGRARPIFEGGWTCSPECMSALVSAAIGREWAGATAGREAHRHCIPLGLIMLEQGWITQSQLRLALDAQREQGSGRLGEWLVRQGATSEERVTRALALQWRCPVLAVDPGYSASLTWIAPRLFVDANNLLPLRVAAGQVLYLEFEEALDPVVAFGIARMTGLRVESGVISGTAFIAEHKRMLQARFPAIELVEAVSVSTAAHALTRAVERARPVASKLVRIHDCLWLRMWRHLPAEPFTDVDCVHDLVCSIGAF